MSRPSQDPFYAEVRSEPGPGLPVRVRPVDVDCGVTVAGWQVVHGSTDTRGRSNAVSGTLLVPARPAAAPGPRPVVSYGVGVHGLGRDAAPSHLLRRGLEPELAQIRLALEQGWAVAVSDGEGLGMPGPHTYGAGRAGGQALLDIARAAVHVVPDVTADSPVLVWGYSEGGRNAAWAAELQPGYAPEQRLVAVAAGGVPADLREVAAAIDGGPFSALNLAVLVGLAHAHQEPALMAVLTDAGRTRAARAATLDVVSLVTGFPEPLRAHTWRDEPWDEPAWRAVLAAERNGAHRPRVPMYVYHVAGDEIVPTHVGRSLAEWYVGLGAEVTWADVVADDHLTGGRQGAPAAVAWLAARLGDADADGASPGRAEEVA
ncbi:lipase family protein [Kineosporia sp. R_H_3]|uniref:lipase family protein n=1 Tax=Kineosporia sp. R_H_3 TaxID=1961848 RepID=UPI000B4B779B|nr:lipase family protein [Kineosporia sp. R_H_3]